MSDSILIKNIRAVDVGFDKICDIFIGEGKIIEIADEIKTTADTVIDGSGLVAIPSLFDMHVHFRDPGYTYKEDILTGAKSALAGGFTGVACMPNTNPVIDSAETVEYIIDKAKDTGVNVYPVGCITKGMMGEELCDYNMLKEAGVVAVSDDGRPVRNAEIMRQALEKSNKNKLLVISHCEDMDIIGKGIVHKGFISEQLGVEGMDRASEDSITAREIALANAVKSRVHIAHVSTEGSVDFIKSAKEMGVKVSCETCPHYFMLTHKKLLSKDADYRMNPPLREERDREAVYTGIIDGTIDCIVTDHAPHSKEDKSDFMNAPNGVVGLETSLSATLTAFYHTGMLKLDRIIELMSVNPRRLLGLPLEKIKEGNIANIAIVNLDREWTVEPEKLVSKSKNTAFKGMKLKGKPVATISEGKLVYSILENISNT